MLSFPGDAADVESGSRSPRAYRHNPWAVHRPKEDKCMPLFVPRVILRVCYMGHAVPSDFMTPHDVFMTNMPF